MGEAKGGMVCMWMRYCSYSRCVCVCVCVGWMGGWMEGWMDGWVVGRGGGFVWLGEDAR